MSVEETDYVGTTNGRSALNGGTVPRWRSNLNVGFTRNNWRVGTMFDYIPKVTDTTASATQTDPNRDRNVPAFLRVNLYGAYSFKGGEGFAKYLDGVTIRGGISNLTDRMPPMAKSGWTDANADTGTYGALGRVFYVDASYKF
jgi:iron complex outermembrane receptor protein